MKTLSKNLYVGVIICLLLVSCFTLSACSSNQITIKQIHDKLSSYNESYAVEYTTTAEKIAEKTSEWVYAMEKQNVDAEHLMVVAVFNRYSSTNRIDILKFSKDKYAKKMIQNYDFGNSSTAKRYGNLIIVVDNDIQFDIFTIINSIR